MISPIRKVLNTFSLFVIGCSISFLSTSTIQAQRVPNATGTLKVLAVMVEFQPDENEYTSGNGTFEEGSLPFMENEDIRIDPLPHDNGYFEAHLTFANNWFRRASADQLTIDYHLAPTIYRLDQEMAEYSPTGEEFTFEKLGTLVRDVWTKVDQGPDLDLPWEVDENTALVIFHAGVGRDIELIGTILDKTYQDIPSIYLGVNTLQGFPDEVFPSSLSIKSGQIPVTNSLIIPRTLSRRGELFEEEQVVSFSINGLLIASLASHMGLPDLFNTETGESAIGQFGLMDGAGFILSYNGLFPPLPSAWERIRLGWESPEILNGKENELIQLPATSLNQSSGIKRYNLTDKEYFLFENRHRDALATGVNLTYRLSDGRIQTQSFTNQDSVFAGQYADFDSLLIKGVLIDVDNPDFALPGGLDYGPDLEPGTVDDRELNGGILIWHIDESVIDKSPNRINADLDRRGIDLEEADGAQDIGNPIEGSLADVSSGHAYDFWWQGNDYRVITEIDTLRNYVNRFGDDTRPNTRNNSGGSTLFEAYDFSPNVAVASFRFRSSQTNVWFSNQQTFELTQSEETPLFNSSNYPPVPLSSNKIDDTEYLAAFVGKEFTLIQQSENFNTFTYTADSDIVQALIHPQRADILLIKESTSSLLSVELISLQNDGLEQLWERDYNESLDDLGIEGRIFRIHGDKAHSLWNQWEISLNDGRLVKQNPSYTVSLVNNANLNIDADLLSTFDLNFTLMHSIVPLMDQDESLVALNSVRGPIIINRLGSIVYDFRTQISTSNSVEQSLLDLRPAFTDLNNDGKVDLLTTNSTGTQLIGYNTSGSIIAGYPIDLSRFNLHATGPLLVFEDEGGVLHSIFEAEDTYSRYLLSVNLENGRITNGFPLSLGSVETALLKAPTYSLEEEAGRLSFVKGNNELNILEHVNISRVLWGSSYGNGTNLLFNYTLPTNSTTPSESTLLNIEETYNWPNPASNETNLRYQSQPGAVINVLISQPSGKIVYRDQIEVRSNLPETLPISIMNWPSGVYLAKVQATLDGQSSQKIIKMVVVN